MNLEGKIVFKVKLDDEIKKIVIHNEDINFNELLLMMQRIFSEKIKTNDEFSMKYTDEENDLVTLANDSDVSLALENSKILKLTIFLKESENKSTQHNAEELENLKPVEIVNELKNIRCSIDSFLEKFGRFVKLDTNQANEVNNGTYIAPTVSTNLPNNDSHKEFDPLNRNIEQTRTSLNSIKLEKTSRGNSPADSINSELSNQRKFEQNEQTNQFNQMNQFNNGPQQKPQQFSMPPSQNSQIPPQNPQMPQQMPQQNPQHNPQIPQQNPQMAQQNSQMPQQNPQNPQMPQHNPQMPQHNPQIAQQNPQMAQQNPQMAQQNSQMPPQNLQMPPQNSQMKPVAPQAQYPPSQYPSQPNQQQLYQQQQQQQQFYQNQQAAQPGGLTPSPQTVNFAPQYPNQQNNQNLNNPYAKPPNAALGRPSSANLGYK